MKWTQGEPPKVEQGIFIVANELGQVCPLIVRQGLGVISNVAPHHDWDFGSKIIKWMNLPTSED